LSIGVRRRKDGLEDIGGRRVNWPGYPAEIISLHRVAAVNEEEPVVWSDRFQFAPQGADSTKEIQNG